ncbi:hypothetical protein BGX31_005520 [Mortierella sp. GBA43]|nr:hypothetical protein BGX31_005520 [Mortierella sp. GBA43]
MADVYPPDNLGLVMGVVMMANAIGFMLGPMVGAYFYEFHGYEAPFVFCAALAVLDFLCILFLAEPEKKKLVATEPGTEETSANIGSETEHLTERDVNGLIIGEDPRTKTNSDGLSWDRQHIKSDQPDYGSTTSSSRSSLSPSSSSSSTTPSSRTSIAEEEDKKAVGTTETAGADVSMFTIASLEPILPLHLKAILNATPTQTGLVLIAAIFPTLFSSLIGYYADRVGHFYVSLAGMFIFAVAAFTLTLPTSFLSFVIPLALFGLGSSTILTPLLPAMADVVTKKGWNGYAKTYALYNMTYSLSMAVGPILAGFIFKDFGFSWTMIMFGVLILVSIPIIFSSQVADVLARWRGVQRSRIVDTV